jgi:hypothetical protein
VIPLDPGFAAIALAFALAQGIVAAPRAATAAEQASEVIAGEVTKIDLEHSRVTGAAATASRMSSRASAEMLKNLKVGDRIEAKRRPDKN